MALKAGLWSFRGRQAISLGKATFPSSNPSYEAKIAVYARPLQEAETPSAKGAAWGSLFLLD